MATEAIELAAESVTDVTGDFELLLYFDASIVNPIGR
ncbi:MAG: hypothetical protein QOH18_554 [Solirubrobacterales bacterium]|jgi:hypothetical protein|nr:hypothetical protein [Solirubrobacterales bacterium]